MTRVYLAGALAMLMAGTAHAQVAARDPGPSGPIQYDVRFDNAAHHEARITVTYRNLAKGPIEFRMARSSPGRYAIHEFAKNVYSVSAVDGAGKALPIARNDPYSWTVGAGHNGTVTVSYTLYADHGDGTYAQIDPTHAHLNMPATFMWAKGYDERPVRVTFHPLDPSWKVATQLQPSDGTPNSFWAPHLQYFMDSPTELSNFALRSWNIEADGKSYTIRLAVHSQDSDAEFDTFAEKAKKVVAEQAKIFGGPASYDFGTYTFIADYMPQITGDGMEHRNSTIISQPRSLKAGNFRQLGTLSHEFFHSWNVERMRPAALEPFDFTRANPTPSLWFAEGFTNYYGPLAIRRAGEMDLNGYLEDLGGTLNYVVNNPARRYGSPQEMSLRAPFVDAAKSIDPVNSNIFVSYYVYGETIAAALDLTLRSRFKGLTLDDYMRHMWKRNGGQKDYAPAKPYAPDDLEAGLAELTKDPAFAKQFFDATIRGGELPDFAPLLANAGLTVKPSNPESGWLGAAMVSAAKGPLALDQIPVPGSPLYKAGVDKGDVLVSLDGKPLAAPSDWGTALAALKPGQSVTLVYRNRGGERSATMTAIANPAFEVVSNESLGKPVTPAQKAFRDAWIGAGN